MKYKNKYGCECSVVLKHGDCVELLKDIPDRSVDMVLCDPPYGIDYQSGRIADKQKRKSKILNDKKPFLDFIPELKRVLKPTGTALIFTRWDVQSSFIEAMNNNDLRCDAVIIWDKVAHGMGDLRRLPARRYESILYHAEKGFKFSGKRPKDIIVVPRISASKMVHPNEKPIALLETLLGDYSNVGDVVLDACMGSGSTGVACANTGRSFIGIELDKKYFDVAAHRIIEAKTRNTMQGG